jgi:hypothetical protein
MNKDEKSLSNLYEATLSPLNGVGMGPQAEDSAGGLGSPTMTKIDVKGEDEEKRGEDDHEVFMAKSELYKLAEYAPKLMDMIDNYNELEGWVQSKITKASDYVSDVYHFLKYEQQDNILGDSEPQPEPEVDVEVVDVDEQPAGEMGDDVKQGVNDEVIKKLMSRF